ncbi:unnamed protein product [Lymnaea stagnalis]|uniref:Uncharacterized protein n=1 Tax=Lymnaea stagnalis TaxID=6523 RepID=A0AAV2HYG0_LYMST
MNSQVYCLPCKYGWNSITAFSEERLAEQERYLQKRSPSSFFKLTYNRLDPDPEFRRETERRCPHRGFPMSEAETLAKSLVWKTQTKRTHTQDDLPPMIRPHPPVTFELRADPVVKGQAFFPPAETLKPARGSYSNDPEWGLYEWRELATRPGFGAWQPVQGIPVNTNVGERSTYLPQRLRRHDPTHEKERWDNLRNLSRLDAISYGYRKQMPGYTGHKQSVEHITTEVDHNDVPKLDFETTSQNHYKRYPDREYCLPVERIKNRTLGSTSRLVTLVNPNNPFTDDSRAEGVPIF